MNAQVVLTWALIVALLIAVATVPLWLYALMSWQYADKEAMRPSARRMRVYQASIAVLLSLVVAFLVGTVWPGGPVERLTAGLVAVVVIFAGLAVWFAVSAARRARSTRPGEPLPPNEPSELGYATDYLRIGVAAAAVVIGGILLIGIQQEQAARREDAAVIDETEQEAIDETLTTFNTLYAPLPVVGMPFTEGAEGWLVGPQNYAVPDAVERTPRAAWEQSKVSGASTSDEALADADLLLVMSGWTCVAKGVVVEETPDAVTVALVVADTAGGERPNCLSAIVQTGWFAVDLASPLGDREVLRLDGGPVTSR